MYFPFTIYSWKSESINYGNFKKWFLLIFTKENIVENQEFPYICIDIINDPKTTFDTSLTLKPNTIWHAMLSSSPARGDTDQIRSRQRPPGEQYKGSLLLLSVTSHTELSQTLFNMKTLVNTHQTKDLDQRRIWTRISVDNYLCSWCVLS